MAGTRYILGIDQGTTSTRAVLFNGSGIPVHMAQLDLPQIFPDNGWVEHDPEDIWQTIIDVTCTMVEEARSRGNSITVDPAHEAHAAVAAAAAAGGGGGRQSQSAGLQGMAGTERDAFLAALPEDVIGDLGGGLRQFVDEERSKGRWESAAAMSAPHIGATRRVYSQDDARDGLRMVSTMYSR